MKCLLALVLLALADGADAGALTGVPRIVDGDTLEIGETTIRLHGIDAPEAGQPYGRDAINALARLIERRAIRCDGDKRDDYARLLATCYAGSIEVNAEMVRSGHAWAFVKYSADYAAAERDARGAQLGMWCNPSRTPQPPWEYRAQRWRIAEQAAPAGCPIKGNISDQGRVFHPPWSPWYVKTRVDEGSGERWFCSEREALAAGWRAPYWR